MGRKRYWMGRWLLVGKRARQKGVRREKYRLSCDAHDHQFRGPLRFKYEDARKDWEHHNISDHGGRKTTMTKDEAINLLNHQKMMIYS